MFKKENLPYTIIGVVIMIVWIVASWMPDYTWMFNV